MSQEQSLHASYKFNKTNFSKVRGYLRDRLNEIHDFNHLVAVAIYDLLKKNKIKKNRNDVINYLDSLNFNDMSTFRKIRCRTYHSVDTDSIYLAIDEILRNDNNTFLKPRRSAYPKLTNKDKSFSVTTERYDITIRAKEESSILSLNIRMGNRSVDNTEFKQEVSAFFSVINSHTWKRNEGGFIETETENFCDDEGQPRYVIETKGYQGSIGEKERKAKYEAMRIRYL